MKTTLKPAQRAVMKIALKTGLLRKCPHHWVYLQSHDADSLQHAIRLGNYLISRMARTVACFKGDRKRMIHELMKCKEEAPLHCAECEDFAMRDSRNSDLPLLKQH